jgi:phosphonate transport system ATP-binding protein
MLACANSRSSSAIDVLAERLDLLPNEPAAASVAPVLRVAGLTRAFSGKAVLRGIDLSVEAGSVIALLGANGTGKSTLLRLMVRLIEPDAGSIEVLGQDITTLNPKALKRFRSRVGFVFQRHNLAGRLSVLTNVVHGVQARASGPRTWWQALAPDHVRTEALECLRRVGLDDRALQRADSLSGGQSQRVAIARMLMQRPELILADEPDASLDPRAGEEVMNLLHGLSRSQGIALIVISHRIEHAIRYSDRIIGLDGGHISLDIPSHQATPERLRAFFTHPENAPA